MAEIEKTCENCKHESKDVKEFPCNNCIHSAIERFEPKEYCRWKYDESEYYYETSCEKIHIFMADGPKENNHKYCPYCGKEIKVVE